MKWIPKFKLLHNWKEILKKSWSEKFLFAAALFQALELSLPYFLPKMPPGRFIVFAFFTIVLAGISRLLHQKGLSRDTENTENS